MRTIHKAMFLMLSAIIIGVLIGSSVNALTFDNRLRIYDEETKTIIIDDNFGLGGDLVKFELLSNTYFCLTECEAVWNITIYKDDDNFLTDLIFEGGNVNSHEFEILIGYDTITLDDHSVDCTNQGKDGFCSLVKNGTIEKQVPIYSSFDPRKKLPLGNYIIRLKGKKNWDITTDWIATIYGIPLRQFAFWAATDPSAVFEFNALTGNAEDSTGTRNMTLNVSNAAGGYSLGKLNNAYFLNTSTPTAFEFNSSGAQFAPGTDDFTIAFWHNGSVNTGGGFSFFGIENGGTNQWSITKLSGNGNFTFITAGVQRLDTLEFTGDLFDNEWHRIIYTRESTGAGGTKLYIDNVNIENGTTATNLNDTFSVFGINPPNTGARMGIDSLQIFNSFAFTPSDVDFDWNGGAGREANITVQDLTVVLNSPADSLSVLVNTLNFNATGFPSIINLTNASILVYNTSTIIFSQQNVSVTGTLQNDSLFTVNNLIRGNYIWNVQFCGLNGSGGTLCNVSGINRTFNILSDEFQVGFNDFSYETAEESYQVNFTLLDSESINSTNLFYNGTSNTATSSPISGNNFSVSSTIDVPSSAIGQNTTQWFFSVNINTGEQINLSVRNQSIGVINLSLFGQGIGGLPYMNFTFENETVAQEAISATFSSTWSYFLGSGTVNKTLTFVNASENFNYSFQFHPQNRTLFADMRVDYSNSESQQRTFDPTLFTLTNSTSLQTLLLLPTSDGVFQQFVTQTLVGNTVPDVNFVINRTIGGTSTEISSGTTDSSGFTSIFLNPDFTYTAIFSKVTFNDNVFSFQPSNQLRTVVMGSSIPAANGSTISRNTNVTIFPVNSTLANATDFLFGFNVSSAESITLITMNITNTSGFQVGFQTNAGVGFISQTINTGENRSFVGTFTYSTGNETITFVKIWQISSEFVGDYSIFRQFTLYTTYGFRDFIRFMFALAMIGGVLIFMTSGETFDTSESKIAVALLLVWAFSIVGWLNTGIPISDSGGFVVLSQFSNQYGLAIISTGAGIFFIGRRIFT